MRVLIYGAGAIGSVLGGILTVAGRDVTLVGRGPHLSAMQSKGLVLDGLDGVPATPIAVRAHTPQEVRGAYDVLLVCLKSHQVSAAAAQLAALRAPDGMLVMVQNGLPWWYFDGVDGPHHGTRLKSVDPAGELAAHLPTQALIGAVIHRSALIVAPGEVRLAPLAASRLVLGELDGQRSARLQNIAALFAGTALPIELTADIRAAKWRKLLSNISFGPLAALTQSKGAQIANDPPAVRVLELVMHETMAVAAAAGVQLEQDPQALIAAAKARTEHPPSLLQDVRAGRPLELDAIVNVVIEMGRLFNVPTPTLQVIAACAGLLNQRITTDKWALDPTTH